MMKGIKLCASLSIVLLILFLTAADGQQPVRPPGSGPADTGPIPPAPSAGPTGPAGGTSGPMGESFFAAGTVSPDGKVLYIVFDKYLMSYSLPELKLVQKLDLGLPTAPVTPSICISPDGKWIYIVQNGLVFQLERETLKIKKHEQFRP